LLLDLITLLIIVVSYAHHILQAAVGLPLVVLRLMEPAQKLLLFGLHVLDSIVELLAPVPLCYHLSAVLVHSLNLIRLLAKIFHLL